MYGNRETDLIIKTWCNFRSVARENEVNVRWHMPNWYVSSMINVWTKYSEPRLYGNGETYLITKCLHCKCCRRKSNTYSACPQLFSFEGKYAHSFFHLRVNVPPPSPIWGYREFFKGSVIVPSKISVRGIIILVHGKWDMC